MPASLSSHIPVLTAPTFRSFGDCDPSLVAILEPHSDSPPEPSPEEKLAAEYERGREAGETQMRAHFEALLEQERAEHARLLGEERTRFDMREAANVGAAIEGLVDVMEQRLSYSVARLLQPFLADRVVDQLVAAFAVHLRQLAEDPQGTRIRLSGPQSLVSRVVEQLPELAGRIDVSLADQVELIAVLDETTIETRLGEWLAQIDAMMTETD